MRSWKVVGRYQIRNNDGEITHTEIALVSETGAYASFTERVVGNHLDKSEEELIELAKSAFFKSEYADRAMSESVQKVDELQAAVAKAEKFAQQTEANMNTVGSKIAQIDAALEKTDQTMAQLTQMVQMVTQLFNSTLEEPEAESEEVEENATTDETEN